MRRLVVIAAIALFVVAVLVPSQKRFVASADDSAGERLAMYSKPAVVRIVDGAAGQIFFQPPGYQGQSFNVSAIALGSGFFISSNGYIATNAHVVSMTHDGEEKARRRESQGVGELLAQRGQHRDVHLDRAAHVATSHVGQEDEVLDWQRLVESVGLADGLDDLR